MLNEIHLALSICGASAGVWAVALGKTAVERSGEMRKMRGRNAESFGRKPGMNACGRSNSWK